ncbi:MAG: hypothetical protein WCR40_00750 [Candidatus Paceibacterota bacterium]
MKKMFKVLLVVLTFSVQCVMASTESSQIIVPSITVSQVNPLWMVSSKDALTSYAISQVSRGIVQIWTATSVYGESFTNDVYCELSSSERSDAFKVLDLLKQQQLYFSVARPDVDEINSYIGLYNKDGWCMFYGWGYGNLLKDEMGNWFPPASLLKFESHLNWEIPIYVGEGVYNAKVILRDENSNVINTKWLDVSDSYVVYSRDFAGQNGEILVMIEGGKSIVASLKDDKVYEVVGVPAKIDTSIDGVIRFDTNASKLVVNPKSYEGYGDSPLVRGTFTEKMWFTLSAATMEGEIPLGVWYRNVETSSVDDWQYLPVSNITIDFGNNTETGNIDIPIGMPGTYEFRFDWKFFGPRPIDYYYDSGNGSSGGKG